MFLAHITGTNPHGHIGTDAEEDCSRDFCKSLVSKVKHTGTIPSECKQYPDLMIDLKRRNSKDASPSAYVGCHAGLVREAQLTRRLTSGKSGLSK